MALVANHSYRHGSIDSFNQQHKLQTTVLLRLRKIQRYLALKKLTLLEEHICYN